MKKMRPLAILAQAFVCVLVLAVPGFGQNTRENADFKLAVNLYNDGLYDLAAEQLRQFISSFPTTTQGIDARFTLGLAQMKLKKYEEARLTFQNFALTFQENPKAPDAWWNVGDCYAALGNPHEAALAFERVKVFHPKSTIAPDALLRASRFFLLAGDRESGRNTLRVVLQEYPSSSAVIGARTELGKLYFEDGNLVQAQNELKRVIEGDPSPDARAGALLVLGSIYQAQGRTAQARTNYQEIIATYKSSSALQGAYLNLGKILAAGGRYPEALENFKKGLSAKSGEDSSLIRDGLMGYGDAQAAMGENSGAMASYEKCIAAGPRDDRTTTALWKLAVVAAHGKDFRRSNDACTRLLSGNAPDILRRRARIRLAGNAKEQSNFASAVQQYESFVEAYPDDPAAPEVLLRIGDICAQNIKDERKAIATYESLAGRFPSSTVADEALLNAARCSERLRDFDHALQVYRTLITVSPSSDDRGKADERIRTIETFEAKDKDAGLEKLALLVGDMVAQKDRAGLAFRLGEIYFTELKNYAAAAVQFGDALEAGLDAPRAADAMFHKAQCYDYMSWKDGRSAPEAIQAYRSFLATAPVSPRSEEAALAILRLSATNLHDAFAAAAPLLAPSAAFPRRDAVTLLLGTLELKADSLAPALAMFTESERTTRDSSIAEEAGFHRFTTLLALGLKDSARAVGEASLIAHPAGAHAAETTSRLAELVRAKDPARAAVLYRQLLASFPTTHAAHEASLPLAEALSASGDNAGALAVYTELYQRSLQDPLTDGAPEGTLLLALGKACQAAGNIKDARTYLTAVAASGANKQRAGEAYAALGEIAKNEGERDVATAFFREAEALSPGTTVSREVADLLFGNGDYADAVRQYAALSAAAQSDTDRRYDDAQTIVALFRSDDPAGAERGTAGFAKKYRDTENEQALFELEKGSYHFRREEYGEAMKAFQRVADKFDDAPSAPASVYWIAKTLEATDHPAEAIQQLETLLQKHPDAPIIPRAHLALGNLQYGKEKWDEAIKHYKMVVDDPNADPDLLPSAMSNLIETYEGAGAFDGALSLTRKYLELYPNSEDALDKKIKIGILYDRLGYYDQAVLQLQTLLDEAGSDLEGELRYYIAEANYNKGDYQQAILDFLKVPYLVTKKGKIDWTANALYMSGQSYEKMGRFDQALTMYRQIVDRTGIDESFKAAARKEIDRVKAIVKKKTG